MEIKMKLIKGKIVAMSATNTIQVNLDVHGSDQAAMDELKKAIKTLGLKGKFVTSFKKTLVGFSPERSGTLTNCFWNELPEAPGIN